MRLLRSYVLASIAAATVFTLALAVLGRESNAGNIMAGWTVFAVYALIYTALLAPIGLYALRRAGRDGYGAHALAGMVLGWLSTMVLFHSLWGLADPMAVAFGSAGLAAGLAFRAGYGPAVRSPAGSADAGAGE